MTTTVLKNLRLVLESGEIQKGHLVLAEGKIAQILPLDQEVSEGETIDGQGAYAFPGFIDLHIHGAAGYDFMDPEPEAGHYIAQALPSEGTTSFLATTMTQTSERISRAIANGKQRMNQQRQVFDGCAEMVGFHLEGPFIHPSQCGAQPVEAICEPEMARIQQWFDGDLSLLKIVSLAPEVPGALQLIEELSTKGVIASAAHTTATYEQIKLAQSKGLRHLTHFTNAMTGLHHREIGVVGAGLVEDTLYLEVIADGIHMHPDMLTLLLKVVGSSRILLITDSMRAKGKSDGTYDLGGQQVTVSGKRAELASGTLAGSVLKMNEAVQLLSQLVVLSPLDILRMTSMNAALRLGIFDRKGSLTVGKDADIVLLRDDYSVQDTFCRGRRWGSDSNTSISLGRSDELSTDE